MHNVIFSSEMASAGKQQHGKALEHSNNPETKEKLYSCSLCSKSFFTSIQLLRHKKIHTGKKPHCCSECTKSFARLDHLKRHMRLHWGETLQLFAVYQIICTSKRFEETCTNSYWREALQLFRMYQVICEFKQLDTAYDNSHWEETP